MKTAILLSGFMKDFGSSYKNWNLIKKNLGADLYISTWDYRRAFASGEKLNPDDLLRMFGMEKHQLVFNKYLEKVEVLTSKTVSAYKYRAQLLETNFTAVNYNPLNQFADIYLRSLGFQRVLDHGDYDSFIISKPDIIMRPFGIQYILANQKDKYTFTLPGDHTDHPEWVSDNFFATDWIAAQLICSGPFVQWDDILQRAKKENNPDLIFDTRCLITQLLDEYGIKHSHGNFKRLIPGENDQ